MDKTGEIRMSMKEHEKLRVLEEVRGKRRTQVSAGGMLGVSDRWVRELLKRVQRRGPAGLIHGNRGRPSNRRTAGQTVQKVRELYEARYEGFNLTHFREMLLEREKGGPVSRETIRTILLEAGLWEPRRKAPKHRQKRPRREQAGELLQMDASIHLWLGEDRPAMALVGGIDDATGDVPYAEFFEAETTQAYMKVTRETVRRRGIPLAVYTDRDSVFVVNDPKQREETMLKGQRPETQSL